ncbi:MAG: hypothetical protein QOG30_134 [Acidimicrobiaceae bacterium]
MRGATRRPGFWLALALAVLCGIGTIVLLTSSVEASRASGAIVVQCGDALSPKTGPEVEIQSIGAEGSTSVRLCDDPIRQRRIVSGVVGVAGVAALIWLGLEIRRAEDDESITA